MNGDLNPFRLKRMAYGPTLSLRQLLPAWGSPNKCDLPVAESAQLGIQTMLDLLSPSRIHAARQIDELALERKVFFLRPLIDP